MSDKQQDLIDKISAHLQARGLLLAVAESCTGGLLASCLTAQAGASRWFERGFVTYSNAAKRDCLGVQARTLDKYGAVSAQTAQEMAAGLLENSLADIGLSITGIAGPDGGSAEKPVGLVHFGCALKGQPPCTEKHIFSGDRRAIQQQAAQRALHIILQTLKGQE